MTEMPPLMPRYRAESRHQQTSVRIVDRVSPESDPFRPGVFPPPDETVVRQLNRRHAVLADGNEVLFTSRKLPEALADARRRNRELGTDTYYVTTVNIDDTNAAGKFVWSAIREWAATNGDDLAGPPLKTPRPEETPEAKAALAAVQVMPHHLSETEASARAMFGGVSGEVLHFVQRDQVSAKRGTFQLQQEIIYAHQSKLTSVFCAYKLNQALKAGESPWVICMVNTAHLPVDDPHRQALQSLNKKTEPVTAGK